jgi:hypothetical protein
LSGEMSLIVMVTGFKGEHQIDKSLVPIVQFCVASE